MKECFKCRTTKPIEDFYKHPQMGDGHLNKCKECTKRDVSKNYRDNRKHYVAYEKERFQKSERKEKIVQYTRKRRFLYPEKYRAHYLTTNAVRDGRLEKTPCEVCGENKVEGHHDDYDKPLDVRWLCRKHHLEVHGKEAY